MNKLKKLINHYNEKGWVIYKNLFSLDEVNSVNLLINNYLEKKIKKINKKSRAINFTDSNNISIENLNSFHELDQCEEIKRLAKQKKVRDVAKLFLNSKPEFRYCELFAKPAKVGLPSPDHQDNYYWAVKGSNALTLWVALEASKEIMLCSLLRWLSQIWVLKHEALLQKVVLKVSDIKFLKNLMSPIQLLPGDALVHHSLVVHGSSKNMSKVVEKDGLFNLKIKMLLTILNK